MRLRLAELIAALSLATDLGLGLPQEHVLRQCRIALALATVAAAAVVVVPPGSAAAPCWQVLVDDWADGAISNLYPISCYRQALQNMPEDVRLYSNASDEINRALAGRAVTRSRGK